MQHIYSLESWDTLLLDNDIYARINFRYICRYFLIIEIKEKSYYLTDYINIIHSYELQIWLLIIVNWINATLKYEKKESWIE